MRKRTICFLLIIVLVLAVCSTGCGLSLENTDGKKEETKAFDTATVEDNTATVEDNFVDNRVMVVLTHEASMEFKSYSAADFPEIACKSVENLSTAAAEKVQAKLRGEIPKDLDVNAAFMYRNVKVDTFKTILSLELENPGKENVLKAVRALEKREDVYYVGPDYILALDNTN